MWAFIHFLQFLRRDKVNNYKLIAVQFLEIVSNMYWRMGKQQNDILFEAPLFFRGFHGFPSEEWGAELFLQLAPWLAAIVPPEAALWQFESKVSDKKRWPEAEILAIRWPENLERLSRGKFRKCRDVQRLLIFSCGKIPKTQRIASEMCLQSYNTTQKEDSKRVTPTTFTKLNWNTLSYNYIYIIVRRLWKLYIPYRPRLGNSGRDAWTLRAQQWRAQLKAAKPKKLQRHGEAMKFGSGWSYRSYTPGN